MKVHQNINCMNFHQKVSCIMQLPNTLLSFWPNYFKLHFYAFRHLLLGIGPLLFTQLLLSQLNIFCRHFEHCFPMQISPPQSQDVMGGYQGVPLSLLRCYKQFLKVYVKIQARKDQSQFLMQAKLSTVQSFKQSLC